MTKFQSSLWKDLLFGSLAIMITKNNFVIVDPWLCAIRFPWFYLSEVGQSWPETYTGFRFLTLRRRLLAVLLLSAVWRSWLSSALDPWLCVAGFSRFCSFSEQLYYCTRKCFFQSLRCSNKKISASWRRFFYYCCTTSLKVASTVMPHFKRGSFSATAMRTV